MNKPSFAGVQVNHKHLVPKVNDSYLLGWVLWSLRLGPCSSRKCFPSIPYEDYSAAVWDLAQNGKQKGVYVRCLQSLFACMTSQVFKDNLAQVLDVTSDRGRDILEPIENWRAARRGCRYCNFRSSMFTDQVEHIPQLDNTSRGILHSHQCHWRHDPRFSRWIRGCQSAVSRIQGCSSSLAALGCFGRCLRRIRPPYAGHSRADSRLTLFRAWRGSGKEQTIRSGRGRRRK